MGRIRKHITVTLPEDILAKVDKLAASERRTRSSTLEWVLAGFFEEPPYPAEPPQAETPKKVDINVLDI